MLSSEGYVAALDAIGRPNDGEHCSHCGMSIAAHYSPDVVDGSADLSDCPWVRAARSLAVDNENTEVTR